jgi:hypothetical protein
MAELVDTAADSVERLVNGGGDENRKKLVSRLGSMHRTLQQRLIGEIVIPLVRNMAARVEAHNYDARNEYACKVCKVMLDSLKADYPFIANGECGLPLI